MGSPRLPARLAPWSGTAALLAELRNEPVIWRRIPLPPVTGA
jgi:hypothetical protein